MHPHRRQSLHDRMTRIAHRDPERHPSSMTAGLSGRRVRHHFPVVDVPVRSGLFCSVAPAADADHLVERGPASERIVRRVHRHEAAAFFHVGLERRLERGRPAIVRRVVVHNHGLVPAELGRERRQLPSRCRCGDDGHCEEAGLVEDSFEDRCDVLPVVIGTAALAVEEHDGNGRRHPRGWRSRQ